MNQSKELKKKAVKEILNKVVSNALYNKPDDITPHIIQVLQDIKGTGSSPLLSKDERKELQMLKEEMETLDRQPQITIEKDKKLCFQSDSEEDDDEEFLDEMTEAYSPIVNQAKVVEMQRNRKSISAEVFGKFNSKNDYKPKCIPKSAEVKEKLKARLSQAFLFMCLDD
jgi:hypothetical protein